MHMYLGPVSAADTCRCCENYISVSFLRLILSWNLLTVSPFVKPLMVCPHNNKLPPTEQTPFWVLPESAQGSLEVVPRLALGRL